MLVVFYPRHLGAALSHKRIADCKLCDKRHAEGTSLQAALRVMPYLLPFSLSDAPRVYSRTAKPTPFLPRSHYAHSIPAHKRVSSRGKASCLTFFCVNVSRAEPLLLDMNCTRGDPPEGGKAAEPSRAAAARYELHKGGSPRRGESRRAACYLSIAHAFFPPPQPLPSCASKTRVYARKKRKAAPKTRSGGIVTK